MKCPNCKKSIPDDALACGYCGTRISQAPAQAPPPLQTYPQTTPVPRASLKLPGWLLPAALGVITLLILGGLLLLLLRTPPAEAVSQAPSAKPTAKQEEPAAEEKKASLSPFSQAEGNWTAEDINDKSWMTMTIRKNPDGSFEVLIYDEGASICGEDENGVPIMAANASGSGFPEDYVLNIGEMTYICENSEVVGNFNEVFTYDPSADTITEDWGAVWNRE